MPANWESPEKAVAHVSGRLKKHRLWDLVLLVFPPLLIFLYVPLSLVLHGIVGHAGAMLWALSLIGTAFLGGAIYYARGGPGALFVARLMDERVAGKDRFLTLVTVQPKGYPPALHERLRIEARELLGKFNIKLQFPYRLKRSFWFSAASSVLLLLLFHLFLYFDSASAPSAPAKQLEILARDLGREARFSALSKRLETLLQRLQESKLTSEEKQSLIEQARQQIAEQKAGSKSDDGGAKNSLQQAEQALEGLEKGTQQGQGKSEGSGGISSNLPQRGAGQSKESEGSGGQGQGGTATTEQREGQDGNPIKPKQGEEKGAGTGGQGQGERLKQEPNSKGENEGSNRGETEGKGSKAQEGEIPGGPNPERYQQPGELGEKSLRGAGYVTVELPEGEATASKSGRGEGKRAPRANFPVSNIPLPPASGPESAREKQQLPLEYRGLIR